MVGEFPGEQGEDCLTLNVWTPELVGARPVLVWLHGGAFLRGSGASTLYHGFRLATRGDVVLVTINYRLGVLGFLAHPELADPDAGGAIGNWGLLDQVAALRWVRDNIAAFGGDPQNVTIFGQSAGGMSVAALLAVPAAQGLFHRAIVQSGPPRAMPAERAEEMAAKLLGELGVGAVADLRRVPVTALLKAEASLYAQRPRTPLTLTPVVDGAVLQADPLKAIADGAAADVPLLIGTNRDEFKLFMRPPPRQQPPDEEALRRRIERIFRAADVHLDALETIESYRAIRRSAGPIDRSPRAVVSDRERPLVPRGLDPCRRGARGAPAPDLQLPVHMGVAGDARCARGLSCPGAALRLRHASLARRRPVRWRLSGRRRAERADDGRLVDVCTNRRPWLAGIRRRTPGDDGVRRREQSERFAARRGTRALGRGLAATPSK